MDRDFKIKIGNDGKPYQLFKGKKYTLHQGERYFRKDKHCMHWHVWEFYNGKRPKGFHIHHKDGNPWNNKPGNLELKESRKHLSDHTKRRFAENPEWAAEFQAKGIQAAPEWHRSKEGKQWHSDNAKAMHKKMPLITMSCRQCGKDYKTKSISKNSSKFCSNKCKSKHRRLSGVDDIDRACQCGNTFRINRYSTTNSCSGCSRKYIRTKKGI